jgi:hypothetical protein
MRAVLDLAVARRYIAANPATGINLPTKSDESQLALSEPRLSTRHPTERVFALYDRAGRYFGLRTRTGAIPSRVLATSARRQDAGVRVGEASP